MPLYALDDIAPIVASDAFVAPDANVIGRVRIGSSASVWWNATLRGDTEQIEVGPRSNVQDGAVLHADPGDPTLLEAEVTVGHRATVHGAHLEPGVLVGIGATVLNGARIGRFSLIGAHSLVPSGMIVPERSMVMGVPAKVKRPLRDDEVERLRYAAEHYVNNALRYRRGLRAL